jgi:hypothetical protein
MGYTCQSAYSDPLPIVAMMQTEVHWSGFVSLNSIQSKLWQLFAKPN